jgi:hypothetical protein
MTTELRAGAWREGEQPAVSLDNTGRGRSLPSLLAIGEAPTPCATTFPRGVMPPSTQSGSLLPAAPGDGGCICLSRYPRRPRSASRCGRRGVS